MTAEATYPYASGDLLVDRNTYFYTPFLGEPFLGAWQAQREAVIARFPRAADAPLAVVTPADALIEDIRTGLDGGDCSTALSRLDRLVQRFEVTKRVHNAYRPDWRAEDPAAFRHLPAYIRLAEVLALAVERTGGLTYLNALLKCCDTLCSCAGWLSPPEGARLSAILSREGPAVQALRARVGEARDTGDIGAEPATAAHRAPTTLTGVAMIACASARSQAYLQALLSRGLRPEKVIFLGEDAVRAGAGEGGGLWKGLVLPDLAEAVTETCRNAGIPLSLTSTRDVNTEEVARLLAESGAQIILYSGIGGQIVSERILRVGPRFLHLHSGWLPDYRGSTTLYYALLNGDVPGVTAILLDPGIDTGPILARRHYPKPPSWMDVDLAYDSAIRADLLCDLMERYAAGGRLDVTDVQSVGEGRTYFVIHPVLKHIALLSIGKRSDD